MSTDTFFGIQNLAFRQMDTPPLFGLFHIAASLAAALAAVSAAVLLARRISRSSDCGGGLTRILSVTGWILVILELYKQLFLFFTVNGGAFDWWFFPFQLCSVPMYLCILMPYVKDDLKRVFLTFMSGYTFISAAAALIYPEDFLRQYISLTAHGFLWHGILLFISLLIFITDAEDASPGGLIKAAGLFTVMCAIAVAINVAAEPLMKTIRAAHPGVEHSWAAMFYMNPYHISPQPIVDSVQKTAGIPAGLVLYALVIAAVSSLVIPCFRYLICMLSCSETRSRQR